VVALGYHFSALLNASTVFLVMPRLLQLEGCWACNLTDLKYSSICLCRAWSLPGLIERHLVRSL
jgi:hypothetical protein